MTEPSFLRTTRAGYDAMAADYGERFRAELAGRPLDRAMLAAFADLVRARSGGEPPPAVADVGCGPGHVTAYLRTLNLDASGVDLSPAMLAWARQAYPGLRFDEGSMTDLDLPDGGLAGILAWYSVMHIPSERLPGVFAEFARVLAPGGQVLVSVQVGDGAGHRAEAFGHAVALDYYLRPTEMLADLLGAAGLPVHARLHREPDADETVPRAYLLAHKATSGAR